MGLNTSFDTNLLQTQHPGDLSNHANLIDSTGQFTTQDKPVSHLLATPELGPIHQAVDHSLAIMGDEFLINKAVQERLSYPEPLLQPIGCDQLTGRQSDFAIGEPMLSAFDDTPGTASDLGVLNGRRTISGSVDKGDRADYYRFELDSPGDFEVALENLAANADLSLYRQSADGEITLLKKSFKGGTESEQISLADLNKGLYLLQVEGIKDADTDYDLIATVDKAGDTIDDARDLGTLSKSLTLTDFLSEADGADYYQFDIDNPSLFTLVVDNFALEDLDTSYAIRVRVAQDSNEDGTVDFEDRDEIAFSHSWYSPFSGSELLEPGTYYLRVLSSSAELEAPVSSNYELSIFTQPVDVLPDGAGASLSDARQLGALSGTHTYSDYVGVLDYIDIYSFELNEPTQLTVTLNGLESNVDLSLISDKNENDVRNSELFEFIEESNLPGVTPEVIETVLPTGKYYVQVLGSSNTTYDLTLDAEPISVTQPENYSSEFGYGLIDAASAIRKVIDSPPLNEVPDRGGLNWGLDQINAPEVWKQGYTGQDTIVAVIDTGVDFNHVELKDNIWTNSDEIPDNGIDDDNNGFVDDIRGWNFVSDTSDVYDDEELTHGTHVAGIIAAANDGFGATGVAYDAKIMPVKVLDELGIGENAGLIDGIRYAVDNGADVINLSLGGPVGDPELEAAIHYATEQGTVVVMAAGNGSPSFFDNYGYNTPGYPARYADEWGIAVGAVDRNNELADFSNRAGFKPINYVVAPGVDIYSTVGNIFYPSEFLTGTSEAAPYVAGVAALLLSANPDLTAQEIEDLIISTANPDAVIVPEPDEFPTFEA